MDSGALLPSNRQPAKTSHPGESSLHHPAMTTKPLRIFDSATSNPWHDSTALQLATALLKVIRLVRMKLQRAMPRTTRAKPTHRRNSIQGFLQNQMVVDISRRENHRKDNAPPVCEDVALTTQLPSVCRVGASLFRVVLRGLVFPLLACGEATLAESRQARLQSILWAA
jgi:type II secretory pathway component PulJ